MSHSKRNTSLAFFTSHERAEVASQWGSKSTRLTRESFLPFGSCHLCLQPAREPVACPSYGHLFCRECALSNLLAQKQELKRLKRNAERKLAEEAEEKALSAEEQRARDVEEFERIQAGLSARAGGQGHGQRIVGRRDGKITVEGEEEVEHKGVKRKYEVDEDELVKLAKEGGFKARRASGKESSNTELPSFWVPSQIPDNQKADIKALKQQPTCPAGSAENTHDFSLKIIVSVNFHTDSSSASPVRSCPSCNKPLSNSTKAVLAKPCGHVLCKPCSDKFQRPAEKSAHIKEHDDPIRCYVCSEDVTPGRSVKRQKGGDGGGLEEKAGKLQRGLVELSTEGTGFAGGGKNMVTKEGVAFQC